MWPIDGLPDWVGRAPELATLRTAADALRRGEGTAVWIEGEPGIGKSSLVAEALAAARDPGWDIGWGAADKLTERLPLQVMLACLGVRPGSPDPRRARAAGLLRGQRLGLFTDGASVAGTEVLLALADELCAAAPTVLVIDDLQWADEASLAVWHQLAAAIGQLRLLLIGTCRPGSGRPGAEQLRAAAARRGGAVISLGPLADTDVAALVTAMVGAPPGDGLRRLTAQAAGNPLYVRELVDALVRERALRTRPTAEISPARERLPVSLAGVLSDRLSSVPAQTAQILRAAALLGGKFAVTDLAVVLRRPVSELAPGLQEALAAGIVADQGAELAFRHPLLQQALYESMPAAVRTALHAEAARELAAAGADTLSVAQQLSAARRPGRPWARAWLTETAPVLATRAPQLAADLLQREPDETPGGDGAWDGLMAGLVRALLAAGRHQEAASQASQALTMVTDPVRRAETYWVLARAQVIAGDNDDAVATVRRALASAGLPRTWRARMLASLAMLERVTTGDIDVADATARQALAAAGEAGDAFATANALADLWLTHGIRRDHAGALDYLDRALHVLGDDALAELGPEDAEGDAYLRERWPALLINGVAALIAGRRDQRATAGRHLRRGLALSTENPTDRENQDFLVAAHALALEQDGETRQAALRLAAMLPRRDSEMTLVHQWLPDLVRLALAAGDASAARAAARACQAEAAAETRPARAAAASLRCQGLLESDPAALRDAVAHYRATGPLTELPAALEDLAVVLAGHGRKEEARAALGEAVSLYDGLQARWDIRRAGSRLRPYGIRHSAAGRRGPRAVSGWEALTPTEVKVAALLARGDSTSDIARGMFLSRRTVQTYISRILAKLGATSRVEIVREALRQDISA
jgi:DNA-binding CsgD family transcriptional regulator/tetratricopeptide (TPR) repeat protein